MSTDDQVEHGTSLDEQVRRCEAYCDARCWTVVSVYREEGVSGSKASRPALNRLMRSAEAGDVNAIVVAKLDRWGRSMRHLAAALGDLDDWQVHFASVAEAIDSSTASGRLLRNVLGAIAEFERETIIERTSSGLRAVASGGFWPGGPPPYGYQIQRLNGRSHLVINPDEASVLEDAVTCIVDKQMTAWETAAQLNAMGHRPRRAPRWTYHNMRRLLLGGHGLSGRWPYGRRGRSDALAGAEIIIKIPAILTPERHRMLNDALMRKSAGPGATARKTNYLLVGRITSACGGSMHGTSKPGRSSRAYRCGNANAQAYEQCDCRSCNADGLEAVVWSEVVRILTDETRLAGLAEAALETQVQAKLNGSDDLASLDQRIARVENALGNTIADLARRGMDAAAVTAAIGELEHDLTRLRSHRRTVEGWQTTAQEQASRMDRLRTLARRAEQLLTDPTSRQQRRVLDLLDVRVHVNGWEPCTKCEGKGFLAAGFAPRSRRSGATGILCPTCFRYKFVPRVEITGVVPDIASLEDSPTEDSVVSYPFHLISANGG